MNKQTQWRGEYIGVPAISSNTPVLFMRLRTKEGAPIDIWVPMNYDLREVIDKTLKYAEFVLDMLQKEEAE